MKFIKVRVETKRDDDLNPVEWGDAIIKTDLVRIVDCDENGFFRMSIEGTKNWFYIESLEDVERQLRLLGYIIPDRKKAETK